MTKKKSKPSSVNHRLPDPKVQEDVLAILSDRRSPKVTNHASSMGDPCERRLVYQRTHWSKASSIDPGLLGIFRTGTDLEPTINRILSEAGERAKPQWRLIGGQQAIHDKLLYRYEISASPDASALQVKHNGEWVTIATPDIKTCSDFTFDAIDEVTDLFKIGFAVKWYSQVSLYAFGLNVPKAMLILVRKSNLYDIKTVSWDVDLDHVEGLLLKAERINKAVAMYQVDVSQFGEECAVKKFPPKVNKPKHCETCAFSQICGPTLEYEEPVTLDDAEIESLLKRRSELDEARKEFERVDADLKDSLPGAPKVIIGPYLVEGTWVESKTGGYWKRKYESKKPIVRRAGRAK